MNQVQLVGRVAKEVKVYGQGKGAFLPLVLAVDGYWDKRERRMAVYFIEVKLFGGLAERCRSLVKGSTVSVNGYIKPNKRERQGQVEYRQDVIVESINFISKPKSTGGNY